MLLQIAVPSVSAFSYTQDTSAPRTPSVSLTADPANDRIDVNMVGNGDTGGSYPDGAIELDETGLVGHWAMDGNFLDSSGNNNNGTAVGGVVATADGQVKQAGSFDGVDDKAQGTWNQPFGTEVTLSAWFKSPGGGGTYPRLIEFSDSSGSSTYSTALTYDIDGSLRTWVECKTDG